jgi:carbamoyl-phosphate synthase large subunit
MGFSIEATSLTAEYLKRAGIRTRVRKKLSEGSNEILEAIRRGNVSYVINTRAVLSGVHYEDGEAIRSTAIENGITMFTSLDTVRVFLDVLEEQTFLVEPIDFVRK